MDTAALVRPAPGAGTGGTVAATPHLVVDGLAKTFTVHLLGGRRIAALHPVTFAVEPGAFVALVGSSGSGKSTLLKCLYRTYLASGGAARLATSSGETIDLAAASDEYVLALRGPRRELGYGAQFLRPTPRVSAQDFVADPLRRQGVAAAEARARATDLLAALGLPPDLADGYPVLFSGGEQQRVNIAHALAAPPRLLLLDEPTSALDAGNRAAVLRLLRDANRSGTTVIAAFHDRALARRVATDFVHLERGRLVDQGRAEQLPPSPNGTGEEHDGGSS